MALINRLIVINWPNNGCLAAWGRGGKYKPRARGWGAQGGIGEGGNCIVPVGSCLVDRADWRCWMCGD